MLSRPRLPPPGFIELCLPSPADHPPTGPGWLHEIKHDGFRLMARRDAASVRLLTRNGIDWSSRFPLIVQAVGALKARSCLIDGEAVAYDDDGLAPFELLRGRRHDRVVALCAFDLHRVERRLPGGRRHSCSSTLARSAARASSRSGAARATLRPISGGAVTRAAPRARMVTCRSLISTPRKRCDAGEGDQRFRRDLAEAVRALALSSLKGILSVRSVSSTSVS
jgi:hypothetical protein